MQYDLKQQQLIRIVTDLQIYDEQVHYKFVNSYQKELTSSLQEQATGLQ